MHSSSFNHMRKMVDTVLDKQKELLILDIGSYDVNGSYRQIFEFEKWKYVGVDIAEGPNVDHILSTPYKMDYQTNSVDVIISGQAFEHIEFFWLTWLEMVRVVKPGGYILLIAPSKGPEHRYPLDCWRFYPDGFAALAKIGKCSLLSVSTDWDVITDQDSSLWGDTVGVYQIRKIGIRRKIAMHVIRFLTLRLIK